MALVKRFPLNTQGRDFVMGDVHGTFSLVRQALDKVGFDPRKDRLFSVGDLVDRGPLSDEAAEFLTLGHAVRGNHESMFLDIYADGVPDEDQLALATRHNGMEWWMDLTPARREAHLRAFAGLPIAIEVETRRGTVGLLHAEVTPGLTWQQFVARVEADDPVVIEQALWGRGRVKRGDRAGVPGVGRVFVGHTPLNRPVRLGNVYYVDTGAVFGVLDPQVNGRLTFADMAARTMVLERAPQERSLVDARPDPEPSDEPYSPYCGT